MDAIDGLLYTPASFVCDKCGFRLEKRTIMAATGAGGREDRRRTVRGALSERWRTDAPRDVERDGDGFKRIGSRTHARTDRVVCG